MVRNSAISARAGTRHGFGRRSLKPAGSLPEGFLYVAAVTSSGETVRGIRVNEDSFTIQLKDAQAKFHSFRKAELKELRRLKQESPMPSFERSLSSAELDDIVEQII